MSTALDVDISTLVGDMEAEPCEHSQHGTGIGDHDDGAATHYVRSGCPGCGLEPVVIAVCQRYTNHVLMDGWVRCDCGLAAPASAFIKILGPVGGTR